MALSERARKRAICEPLKMTTQRHNGDGSIGRGIFWLNIHFYLLIRLSVTSGYESFPMAIELTPATHEIAIFLALCEAHVDKTRSISLYNIFSSIASIQSLSISIQVRADFFFLRKSTREDTLFGLGNYVFALLSMWSSQKCSFYLVCGFLSISLFLYLVAFV